MSFPVLPKENICQAVQDFFESAKRENKGVNFNHIDSTFVTRANLVRCDENKAVAEGRIPLGKAPLVQLAFQRMEWALANQDVCTGKWTFCSYRPFTFESVSLYPLTPIKKPNDKTLVIDNEWVFTKVEPRKLFGYNLW